MSYHKKLLLSVALGATLWFLPSHAVTLEELQNEKQKLIINRINNEKSTNPSKINTPPPVKKVETPKTNLQPQNLSQSTFIINPNNPIKSVGGANVVKFTDLPAGTLKDLIEKIMYSKAHLRLHITNMIKIAELIVLDLHNKSTQSSKTPKDLIAELQTLNNKVNERIAFCKNNLDKVFQNMPQEKKTIVINFLKTLTDVIGAITTLLVPETLNDWFNQKLENNAQILLSELNKSLKKLDLGIGKLITVDALTNALFGSGMPSLTQSLLNTPNQTLSQSTILSTTTYTQSKLPPPMKKVEVKKPEVQPAVKKVNNPPPVKKVEVKPEVKKVEEKVENTLTIDELNQKLKLFNVVLNKIKPISLVIYPNQDKKEDETQVAEPTEDVIKLAQTLRDQRVLDKTKTGLIFILQKLGIITDLEDVKKISKDTIINWLKTQDNELLERAQQKSKQQFTYIVKAISDIFQPGKGKDFKNPKFATDCTQKDVLQITFYTVDAICEKMIANKVFCQDLIQHFLMLLDNQEEQCSQGAYGKVVVFLVKTIQEYLETEIKNTQDAINKLSVFENKK